MAIMTTPSARVADLRRELFVIGSVWAAAFALAHVYWAAGGRFGVPDSAAPIADRPVFLAYDVVSAVVLLAAAVVSTVLASERVSPSLRAQLESWTRWGAALALLRGGVGLVQDVVGVVLGHGLTFGALFDVWFFAAGVLYAALVGLPGRRD